MAVIIDLTEGEEAFGEETTYFGGTIHVTSEFGQIASRIIDGMTDRDSYNWIDWVYEQLKIQLIGFQQVEDEDEETFELWNEISIGNKYEATVVDGKLVITEICVPRQDLTDKFWASVEPSINGYSAAINRLLDALTDEQLQEL